MSNLALTETPCNRAKRKTARKITLFEEHVFHQWVTNVWAANLTPTEFKVLIAVFARTVAWGKMWEIIPTRHLQHGIKGSAPGAMHFAGTGLSRPTIFKCLDRLATEGYILRRAYGQTRSYAVNLRAMGTVSDPGYAREVTRRGNAKLADRVRQAQRAAIVAAEQAYRATGTTEARETWMALLGPVRECGDVVELKGRRVPKPAVAPDWDEYEGATPMENPCENTGEAVEAGQSPLPINKRHKPSNDASLRSATLEAGADALIIRRRSPRQQPEQSDDDQTDERLSPALPPAQHWRDRERRVRRRVANVAENLPVIDFARNAPGAPALAHANRVREELQAATEAPVDDSITRVLTTAVNNNAMRKRAALTRKEWTATKIEKVWIDAVTYRCGGRRPVAWHLGQKAKMKSAVTQLSPLPDPAMTWGLVADWVARNFGLATSLAVPFMLQDLDRRDRLLRAAPSHTMFIHFASYYVNAYATAYHGEGFTEEDEERARADARLHDSWMARVQEVQRDGYDNLSRRHMTNGELEQLVERLAADDAQAQAVLDGREEHRELARTLRRTYGPQYRQMLEQHIARAHIAAARAQQRPEDFDMPTQDLSDYMDD